MYFHIVKATYLFGTFALISTSMHLQAFNPVFRNIHSPKVAAILSVYVISTKANDTVIIFNCRLDHLLYQNLFGYACFTRGLFQIFAMIYHDLLWLEIYLSMLCFIFDAIQKQSVRWMNSLNKQIFYMFWSDRIFLYPSPWYFSIAYWCIISSASWL